MSILDSLYIMCSSDNGDIDSFDQSKFFLSN